MGESIVLCVDGSERFERAIADHLERGASEVSLEFVSLAEARDRVGSTRQAGVVVGTPSAERGVDVVRQVRGLDSTVPILYVTDGDVLETVCALANGASDYVERAAAMRWPATLLERLERLVSETAPGWSADQVAVRLREEVAALRADSFDGRRTPDRRFEAIFNNTYQFTGLLKPDGTLIEANETALSFGGLERADVVGVPLWETAWFQTNDETRRVAREAIDRARAGEMYRADVRIEGADRVASIDFSVRPITDDRGEVTTLVAEGHDVSELKAYERRLERQRDNLELLNQVVRHDIRNDLQLVQAYASSLEPHVDDDGRAALEVVLEAAENAIDLTGTARNLAVVMLEEESDTRSIPLEPTLDQQLEEIDSGFPDAVVTVEGSIPNVDVEGTDLLGAVFRNLLKNAILHNDAPVPEVTVGSAVRDGQVEVQVADNGPGIRDAQKAEIFGEGEKGLESGGSGIGLYLVNTLVENYGGDVWVEDNDPRGAIFVVRLPMAESSR